MPSKEIRTYFDHTANRETRDDLMLAASLVEGERIAIDCGCGAGSDIAFLRSQGFLVHAFDAEEEAIGRCRNRFIGDSQVLLSRATFDSFRYPKASLLVADASLHFCPAHEFSEVWRRMTEALLPHGVFCGSFLGPEDTMARSDYDKAAYWSDIQVFSKEKISSLFRNFQTESFIEHRSSGTGPDDKPYEWHLYAVVARISGT